MRVMMMAAEAEPFAKGGGLGDAVTGMAVALAGAGVKVSVFLPLYAEVARRGHRPRATGREVTLAHDGREHTAALHRARRDGVDFIFVREDGYFGRDAIYGTPAGEYPDSPQRYSFFTRAALAGAEALGLAPDVVHCHDWHAALAPWYLGGGTLRQARGGEGRRRPPVLLTVHNLAYQGIYDASLVGPLGLPPEGFGMEGYEFYGGINFLKGGLMAADAINTVSPTYAREILVPGMGEGLDGVLRARQGRLSGILNGIEDAAWDPAEDAALPRPFSARAPAGKRACKKALQKELGLAMDPSAPLFSFIGRLTGQKGVELLTGALPRLLALGGQLALLGSGESRFEELARQAAAAEPGRVAARILFDPHLARRIYAGSDFFLMPSLFEPCGLGQMYAMRYGALPVARRTGGLADTVRDLSADPAGGNGFLFGEFTAAALEEAIGRAAAFHRGGAVAPVLRRVMLEDHSWAASAARYHDIYRELAA